LSGFKDNKYRILVATDIAARGIDVSDIELVLNYDLPEKSVDYVHRIGRTARAGKKGKAISFATTAQGGQIRSIEALIKKNLTLTKFAELTHTSIYSSHNKRGRRMKFATAKFSQPSYGGKPGNKGGYSQGKRPFRSNARGPRGQRSDNPRSEHGFSGFASTDRQRYRQSIRSDRRH
jgi:ATP-dependent RNA helicase RhlE